MSRTPLAYTIPKAIDAFGVMMVKFPPLLVRHIHVFEALAHKVAVDVEHCAHCLHAAPLVNLLAESFTRILRGQHTDSDLKRS